MNKLLMCALSTSICAIPALAVDERPNVIVFLVDDMGLMDTSVPFLAGEEGTAKKYPLNNFYRTPGMERLASQGVRFGRFYANSVCSPTRATIMTGQSSARNHTTQWIDPYHKNAGPKAWNWKGLTKTDVTLPRILQKAGYETIHCGKAHFGPENTEGSNPLNLGFDVNIGGRSIGRPGSYLSERGYGAGTGRQVPGLEEYHNTGTFLTEALTLEVNKALTKNAKTDKPFYLYMSHYAVHAPFDVDKRFIANYKGSGQTKQTQAYAALLEGMDKSLNDIINKLELLGEAENTVILFLGDNGSDAPIPGKLYNSSAPLRGKKAMSYEGGLRVPFIASWAKVNPESKLQQKFPIKQGYYNDNFASAEDVFPTVLKYVGLDAPESYKVDGVDLTGYFKDWKGDKPQHFLMHFPHSHRSSNFTVYVDGDWKLIYNYSGHKIELFDLAEDPYEAKNVASVYPEKVKELKRKMVTALDDAGAQYRIDKKTGTEMRPRL